MSLIDKLINVVSPETAKLKNTNSRLLKVIAAYEAADNSRYRKKHRESRSQNQEVERSAIALREEARHLQQNHDLSRGALRTLTNNVIGPNGIGVEPQPRIAATGEIDEVYAAALSEAWRDWCLKPEVTQRLTFAKCQRLAFMTKVRDGECFAQTLTGPIPYLDHGTVIPFSIELFEPDRVPMDYNDSGLGIRQGIQLNAWGRPKNLFVYKKDPKEIYGLVRSSDVKTISWDNVLHLVSIDRIGQLRGVSEFASVITRLIDIKDYEESERIAAKIAASLTAYIKKGDASLYGNEDNGVDSGTQNDDGSVTRDLSLQAGIIFDGLEAGEDVGMIKSDRPNPNLVGWRQGQLKAFAAGLGGSYSSISRDYNGNYSAQRQEMIEQWVHYAVLSDDFVGEFVQPTYKKFVMACHLSGKIKIPDGLEPGSFDDALFIGQTLPWIDPLKEASAAEKLVKNNFASETEVIRRRGQKPNDVLTQKSKFKKKAESLGLSQTASAADNQLENNSDDNQE